MEIFETLIWRLHANYLIVLVTGIDEFRDKINNNKEKISVMPLIFEFGKSKNLNIDNNIPYNDLLTFEDESQNSFFFIKLTFKALHSKMDGDSTIGGFDFLELNTFNIENCEKILKSCCHKVITIYLMQTGHG